jgi:hypothetical protein
MIMRSWQLGLIDDHRRMELFRQRSAKGWCRKEPDDDLVERDENSVCQKAAQLLIQHDPLMYDRLLDQQQISPDILQDVFSLHRTTFAFKPTLRLLNTEPK